MASNPCPICDKPLPGGLAEWPDYPFCSPRCRRIDLGRWLGEQYRFPAKGGGSGRDEDESSEAEGD